MRCYLVRNADTEGVLGLFWAEGSERLWWLVDQANGDPPLYEYSELTDGFLAFTGKTEPPPRETQGRGTDGHPGNFNWSNAEASEALLAALHGQLQVTWKRLPAADEPGGGLHGMAEENSDGGEEKDSI